MLLLASSYFIEVLLGLEPWEHGSAGCVGVLTRVQGQLCLCWALLTATPAQGTRLAQVGNLKVLSNLARFSIGEKGLEIDTVEPTLRSGNSNQQSLQGCV